MSMYALFGASYNEIGRCITVPAPESANSLFPIANLYDGIPNKPFVFGSAGGSGYIDFDMQRLTNGGFETWSAGAPVGWTVTTVAGGNVTEEAVIVNGGSKSARLGTVGGLSDSARVSQRATFRAGSTANLSIALYGPAAGAVLVVYLRCVETGNYLQLGGGSWGAINTLFSQIAQSWASNTVTFTVEPYSTTHSDTVTLEVIADLTAATGRAAYVDDAVFVPGISAATIHGHNVPPASVPLLLKSGASSPGTTTTRGTFTLAHPTMYTTFNVAYDRYWRLLTTADPPTDAIWLGELVLGEAVTMLREQNYGQTTSGVSAQDRSSNEIGPLQAFVRTERDRREVELQFRYTSAASFNQREELLARSRNGAYPFVLILDSSDATSAMMVRVPPRQAHQRSLTLLRDASITTEEMPFPVVIA